MKVTILESDVEQLRIEIESAEEVGLHEIFFKFQKEEQMFRMNIEAAKSLLYNIENMFNLSAIYVTLDLSPFIEHIPHIIKRDLYGEQ